MTERTPGFYVGAGSVAGLVIGSFGPWAKVTLFGASVSGVDGSNDGWLILALAAFAAIALFRNAAGNWRGIGVLGVLAVALSLYDRSRVQHAAGGSKGFISVGWGLNLVLAGAVGLLAATYFLREDMQSREEAEAEDDEYELRCTACGEPTSEGDRYCPSCGAEFDLSSDVPAAAPEST